ncbi:glycosyl hydrolase family 8 [Klebsiella pneumoniae]
MRGRSRSTPRPEKPCWRGIVAEETVAVPGLGTMLLPGKVGFADDSGWRFNPSYLPPQAGHLLCAFSARRGPLCAIGTCACCRRRRRKGFTPDWVRYEKRERLAAENRKAADRQL